MLHIFSLQAFLVPTIIAFLSSMSSFAINMIRKQINKSLLTKNNIIIPKYEFEGNLFHVFDKKTGFSSSGWLCILFISFTKKITHIICFKHYSHNNVCFCCILGIYFGYLSEMTQPYMYEYNIHLFFGNPFIFIHVSFCKLIKFIIIVCHL